MNFRSRAFFAPALAIAILALNACGGGSPSPAGGRGRMGGPIPVVAVTVEARQFTDEFTALGTARSNESIQVTPRISSVVTRIAFEEGQDVQAGDLLVELDNRELRAKLEMAKAALRKVRSQYRRRKSLAENRVISEAELEELEADVLAAEADVRSAEARLRDSYIYAPFAGTVGLRRVSVGSLVGPDTVITTLDDMDTLKLDFTVPEAFLDTLKPGMTVHAVSEVYPERRFAGTVISVDSRVDPDTRSIAAVARLPNPDRLIRPGMFLTVKLQRTRDNVLLVPEEALVPQQGRQYVFIVKDGKAVRKAVELGARAPGLAEVVQGISPGDLVITEGTQKVYDGSAVQLLPPEPVAEEKSGS